MLRTLMLAWALAVLAPTLHAQETKDTSGGIPLPKPFATPSARKFPKVVGWSEGQMPKAPTGFRVNVFAKKMDHPRWLYVLPNGDVLAAEASTPKKAKEGKQPPPANKIILLRDADGDGTPEVRETFLAGLNLPFGMTLIGDQLYVGCTDGVWRFPYTKGQTSITAKGQKILDLPVGGYNNHWTRNLLANQDGSKIYVTVGSGSNVAEHGMKNEVRRANILEINPDGSGERIYASGLRNPVGLDWEPTTHQLWTVVNERDELGDDLVPDYLTSVRAGGFYGWPYSYFGQNVDPRRKGERPDLVAKAIVPDLPLGSHTASLGLHFNRSEAMPKEFREGAFIGQHGSWNRSQFVGYRVAFVPFAKGQPAGADRDFLTGFIKNENEVYGRPVGLAQLSDGSLLVVDDDSNVIWRVSVDKTR